MPTSNRFIASPTPRSVELLIRVLSAFPTLQLILSFNHRSDIIHLARTCRTLASMLTESISPLRRPFPRCTVDLASCQDCQAIVCTDCQKVVQELEQPSSMFHGFQMPQALVITPETNEVRLEVLSSLRTAMRHRGWPMAFVPVMQCVERKFLCASCFKQQHRAPNRLPQIFHSAILEWSDLPNTHTTCACTDGNRAQCEGDKHLVAIEDVLVESQFMALVTLPPQLRSRIGSDVVIACPLYILGP
ncbi:hypothetical protein BGX38DRAFT_554104 [Terfezia claveryi]|nr:hypothetical protein BGX38DRAFT_554104 [Terfezia claveryi]